MYSMGVLSRKAETTSKLLASSSWNSPVNECVLGSIIHRFEENTKEPATLIQSSVSQSIASSQMKAHQKRSHEFS